MNLDLFMIQVRIQTNRNVAVMLAPSMAGQRLPSIIG